MARDDYGGVDQQAVTSWREKKAKDLRAQLRRELANFLSEALANEIPVRRAGALATTTRFPLAFEELASFEEETFDSAAPPASARSAQVGSIQRVGRTTSVVSDSGSCWQAASSSKPLRLLREEDQGTTFPLAVQERHQMADGAADEGTAKIATPRVSGHIVSLVAAAAAQEVLAAEEETQQPYDSLASIRAHADQRDKDNLSASWPGCAQSLDHGHGAADAWQWDEPSKSSLVGQEDDFSASPYTDGLDVEALTVSTIADAAFELPVLPPSLMQQKRKPGCIYNTTTSAVPSSATSCAGSFAAAPRVTPTLLCSTEAAVRSGAPLGTPAKSWASPSPLQIDGQDEAASPLNSSSSDLGRSPAGPGPESKCPPPRLPLCLGRPDPSGTPTQQSATTAGGGQQAAAAPQAVRTPEELRQQRLLPMPGAGPVLGAPCSVQAGDSFAQSIGTCAGQGLPAAALRLKLPLAGLESERNYITTAVPAHCAASAAASFQGGIPLRQSSSASSIAPVIAAAPAAYAQIPGDRVHGLRASGSTTPPWVQHHQAYGALPGVNRQPPPRAQDNFEALTAQFESVTNELTRHLQQGRRDLDAATPACGSSGLPVYKLDDFKQAQTDGVRLRPSTSVGLHILPPPPSLMPPPL